MPTHRCKRYNDGLEAILAEDYQYKSWSTVYRSGMLLKNVIESVIIEGDILCYTGDAVIDDKLHIVTIPRDKCVLKQNEKSCQTNQTSTKG